MQPNEFKYTLIIPGADPYVLLTAPIGWQEDTEVEFSRSDTYFGAVRNITVPLKFTFGSAKRLRNLYFRYGVQSTAYLLIEKLDPSTWKHETAYYGRLDFSKAKDADNYFSVNCVDADLSVKLKKFENTRYEINVDVPEAIDVEITPLKLIEKADFIFLPSETDQQPGYTGLIVVNNEVKSVNQSVKDVAYRTEFNPNFATDGDWFYTAQIATTVKVKFEGVQGSVQSFLSGGNRFRLELVKSTGVVVATLFDISINNGVEAFNIDTELNVPISTNERLYLYERMDGSTNSNTGFNWYDGTLSISYETESPATKCKALRGDYVFKQLIKQINGGFDYPTQSFLLQQWSQLVLTSGDAIRQIPGAKIKTSFADFFKSYSAVTCAGSAVENGWVTFESRQSYFRNVQTLSMLDSKDVTIEPANELLFNTIKAGYPDQTYDEVNGKDEVNSIQYYAVDVFGIEKELDITSVYRADPYGIEFLRINLDGKATTDSNSDNDTFFLYINANPEVGDYYQVETPASAGFVIEGVGAGDSYYNFRISPKRNLYRWGAYIRSVFYNNPGYQLRFTTGLKNTAMKSTGGGNFVIENANVLVASLAPAYFMPYYANLTTDLPNNFWKYATTGIYGYGLFSYRDLPFKGYFVTASVDLAMNSERDFKLLLTANNNILELIR